MNATLMNHRWLVPAFVCSLSVAVAEPQPSSDISKFLDSIGVCTHWSYADTPYGSSYETVRAKLIASGIRHVRDHFHAHIEDLASVGIQTTVIVEPDDGSPLEIAARIRDYVAKNNAIAAVEGPHQPDVYWPRYGRSYHGKGFPDGAIAFQRELYHAIKNDDITSQVTVIGMALGDQYDADSKRPFPYPDGALSELADWGNCHPYPFQGNPAAETFDYGTIRNYYRNANFPSILLDEFPMKFKREAAPYSPRPMAVTETGYPAVGAGISSESHGKYIPRLFAEHFRLGIQRTYLAELVDEFEDPEDIFPKAHFGLLQRDLKPKPGYAALQSLILLLRSHEPSETATPEPLEFTVLPRSAEDWSRPQDIHHLLLHGYPGEFFLLIWHEVSNEDVSSIPHRQIDPPPRLVLLTFESPIQDVIVYQYGIDWRLAPSLMSVEKGGRLELMVDDQLMVVRLRER